MRFAILHISDLHRDLSDEIGNSWLLESLTKDFEQYQASDPGVLKPSLCVVSGDLVYGVGPHALNSDEEMKRQYEQAEGFLIGLADKFFDGQRQRVIILPGNHDVCYTDVMASVQKIEVPPDARERKKLTAEFLMKPHSQLRWSWDELCFYRIIDEKKYQNRFRYFASTYDSFYQGRRTFSLQPEQQYDIFDFPDLAFCLVTLNSCYSNDPLRRTGAFHPDALTSALQALRAPGRTGWLIGSAWHHNLTGGPTQDDYLDVNLLQILIDSGLSLGFHGHQHFAECVDERYRLGPKPRKMTIISAGTLCAAPQHLQPGTPRAYNVVELDTDAWRGRVHMRQMVNTLNGLPIWGPGHFIPTDKSYIDFELSQPETNRPANLDLMLSLERAETLLGRQYWSEAVEILSEFKEIPLARPLLAKALTELDQPRNTIRILWPPTTKTEIIIVGGAILEEGTKEEAQEFLNLDGVSTSTDASVTDISARIRERRLK